jgi:hypothetical protein
VLLDAEGNVIPPESDDDATKQLKLNGQNKRAFRVRQATLMEGWE